MEIALVKARDKALRSAEGEIHGFMLLWTVHNVVALNVLFLDLPNADSSEDLIIKSTFSVNLKTPPIYLVASDCLFSFFCRFACISTARKRRFWVFS